MMVNSDDCKMRAMKMDPASLVPNWHRLGAAQKDALFKQIEQLDFDMLSKQKNSYVQKAVDPSSLSVFSSYEQKGNPKTKVLGKKVIADGAVGCLVVAGGQGSRLNDPRPKGFFPVSPVYHKSLFQLLAEKVEAASRLAGRPLDVAIMTSLENDREIRDFFEKHSYFGLEKSQVFFYPQSSLPFLDEEGRLVLIEEGKIATGPDGNASSLKRFVESGIWKVWRKKGVRYVQWMQIDNPLADPFDPELAGFHEKNPASDLVLKCVARRDAEEKVGVLFDRQRKVTVVEYSELPEDLRKARTEEGSLAHLCGNIGFYSFQMDFIQEVALQHDGNLHLHKAWKSVERGGDRPQKMAWKFEKFIFDVLPWAREVKALLYPRSECFAPLKNAIGEDSPASVAQALQTRDRQVFEEISGTQVPSKLFELDPAFYYPTQEMLEKWKGKKLPDALYVLP